VNSGDDVRLERQGDVVHLRVLKRSEE